MKKSSAEFSVSVQTATTYPATVRTEILQRINTNHHTTASSDGQLRQPAQTTKFRQPAINIIVPTFDPDSTNDIIF